MNNSTYDHVKSILGDKTDAAIELAQNLLELQLKLDETKIPNLYIDEFGRVGSMTKFGFQPRKPCEWKINPDGTPIGNILTRLFTI